MIVGTSVAERGATSDTAALLVTLLNLLTNCFLRGLVFDG
jgi:hypothetical protein